MTQMNPQLRDELTQLLAAHIQETVDPYFDGLSTDYDKIAEVAMDFIYGSDDVEEVVEPVFDTDIDAAGLRNRNACRCSRCGVDAVSSSRVPMIVEAPAAQIEELVKDYQSGRIMGSSLTGVMFIPSELVFPQDGDDRDPTLPSELYDLPQESGRDGSSPSPQTPDEEA